MSAPGDDAHTKLIEWGIIVRQQFDLDNLHLTAREGHGGAEKVISAVKQLGSAIASSHTQLADVVARQITIETKLDRILNWISSGPPRPA
eukprot:1062497-Prymnesium_polylepis.1